MMDLEPLQQDKNEAKSTTLHIKTTHKHAKHTHTLYNNTRIGGSVQIQIYKHISRIHTGAR